MVSSMYFPLEPGRPLWSPWLVENGRKATVWLLHLGHKRCYSFHLEPILICEEAVVTLKGPHEEKSQVSWQPTPTCQPHGWAFWESLLKFWVRSPRWHHVEQRLAFPTETYPNCRFMNKTIDCHFKTLSVRVVCYVSIDDWKRLFSGRRSRK